MNQFISLADGPTYLNRDLILSITIEWDLLKKSPLAQVNVCDMAPPGMDLYCLVKMADGSSHSLAGARAADFVKKLGLPYPFREGIDDASPCGGEIESEAYG